MESRYEAARKSVGERQAEIEKRLAELRARDPRARARAAQRLGELEAGAEALLRALDDRNAYVRSAAAEALGYATAEALAPDIIDALLAAINDPNDYVSSAAIRALGRLQAEPAREQIIECLDDRNPHVVEAAVLALARLGPPALAARLAQFLSVENEGLGAAAARAMAALGYAEAGPELLRQLELGLQREWRGHNRLYVLRCYVEALARLQVRAAIPLLLEIAQRQVGLRSAAVEALMELQAAEAAPLLATMLSDPSERLRRNLIQLMQQAGYRLALPIIRPLLHDPSISVRRAALAAVTQWRDAGSLAQVRRLCQQEGNPYLRAQAVSSLQALAGEQAMPDLLALIADPNTLVRQAALLGLDRYGKLPAEALAQINGLLAAEPVPEIAGAARAILARHAYTGPASGGEAQAVPPPLVPASLSAQAPALLAALERWQEELPSLASGHSLEELGALDAALSAVIAVLRGGA